MGKKNETKPKSTATANEDLLVDIIAAFVEHPEEIGIETESQGVSAQGLPQTMMVVSVHKADYGKAMGKQGTVLTALQTIFAFVGQRDNQRIRLRLEYPGKKELIIQPEFVENPNWNPAETVALLRRLLERIFVLPFFIEVVADDYSTALEIRVDPKEHEIIDGRLHEFEGLREYLTPIFYSIGKAQGVRLQISVPKPIPVMTP